jgi:hypothetical protein
MAWLEDLFELSNNSDDLYYTHPHVMIHIKNILKYPVTSHLKCIVSTCYSLQRVSVDLATSR